MFRPQVILGALVNRFGSCVDATVSREEQRTIGMISSLLMSGRDGNLQLRQTTQLYVDVKGDEDSDWSGGEEEEEEGMNSTEKKEGLIYFGDKGCTPDYVREMIDHYRAPSQGHRSKEAMKNRYRFLDRPHHFVKLLEIEKQYEEEDNLRGDRKVRQRELARRVKEAVEEKVAQGALLDDEAISILARKINEEHDLVDGFRAGLSWVNSFKRNSGFSSRAVNCWESPNSIKLADEIEAKADKLVATVRSRLTHFPLSSVVNADQSGVVKELYKARTIAKTGTKKVVCSVQRKNALTHSYTILPTYYADGHLGSLLYVVLPEAKGSFPAKGHVTVDNLVVRAAKTHMMTKSHMVDWLKTCVFASGTPDDQLLLVDSWSSFTDHATMKNTAPSGKKVEIHNIPPGATSKIQPCDVNLFRQMKSFIKKVTSHVRMNNIDFVLSTRDNLLLMISQMYCCFCSPIFQPYLAYGWFKAGYLDERPQVSFLTPVQYCFNPHLDYKCEVTGCSKPHLLKCPYCNDYICFTHFVIQYHRC